MVVVVVQMTYRSPSSRYPPSLIQSYRIGRANSPSPSVSAQYIPPTLLFIFTADPDR